MAYVRGTFTSVTPVAIFAVQDPALQVLNALHLCPQVPQLEVSVLRLVQVPLQQVAVSPEQIFPQVPQLPLLVVRFTQVLPQFVSPKTTQLNL